MYVFNNHKYSKKIQTNYDTIISYKYGSLILDIGIKKPIQSKRRTIQNKEGFIKIKGIRKELLEYHYGIYRMFPCGKQHQYHMQYLHVPGVTERSIY